MQPCGLRHVRLPSPSQGGLARCSPWVEKSQTELGDWTTTTTTTKESSPKVWLLPCKRAEKWTATLFKSEQLPSELGGIKEKKNVQACSLFSLYSLFSGNEDIKTHSAFFLFTATLSVNIQGWNPLELTGLISLHSKGLSRVFSITAVRNHQFFGTQHFLLSVSHTCTWLLEKP